MLAFEFLYSPYNRGITLVLDKGLPIKFIEDYLKICGEYIDYIKLGWGTSATINKDLLKNKIRLYQDYNIKVYPGGTLFEYCILKDKFNEFLDECKDLNFDAIEISDGSLYIEKEDRGEYIKRVKEEGFEVLTEVGKKNIEKDKLLSIDKRIELIKFDLDNGADYVIIEGRESGKGIGVYDKNGNVKEDEINKLVNFIDIKNLIFEAPQKHQQVYFIKKFGSKVNLGNIAYDEVISLETLRRGLRGDTFGII